ncbi:MAG TPA: 2-amino-4-hydroxy-6-hydroxymethyldihydropteridine diphosphokinase [Tepidisphaeraceae bacterium]|nr:2-amino-4-hydroxy-6-hydroxymethyldihydropteridine diphosphokinase [Tepidisphaeraceae bacterium]
MRSDRPITAYLALGSNIGDREKNIYAAVGMLAQSEGIQIIRFSNFLENPAIGMGDDAPPFLNAALQIETTLGSHALLDRMIEIEQSLGRDHHEKWESRTIDLDLLLYGDQIISSQPLIVPHPLMHERRFVLQPLSEIAPEVVHPTLQMTISGLLEDLAKKSKVRLT